MSPGTRRERPELCARLASLNQPTAPSPRPSPPPRGRGCPKGGRGGGSWAGGKDAQFPEFSRPLLWNCFMGTHVGGYHQRSTLRHLRAGGFEDSALAFSQALDAMRGDFVEDRIDFLADKIGASGHFRRDILPSPQERPPRSAHFGRHLRAALVSQPGPQTYPAVGVVK